MEIERFRRELDTILAVAQDLAQRQQQPGAGVAGTRPATAAPLATRDPNVSPGPPVSLTAASAEFSKHRQRTRWRPQVVHGDGIDDEEDPSGWG